MADEVDSEELDEGSELEEGEEPEGKGADEEEVGWWEDLRDFYLTFDRRTLGLTRIFLGFLLLTDLFRRTGDWWWMFSNEGVLPAHHNLWRPQSSGISILPSSSTRTQASSRGPSRHGSPSQRRARKT